MGQDTAREGEKSFLQDVTGLGSKKSEKLCSGRSFLCLRIGKELARELKERLRTDSQEERMEEEKVPTQTTSSRSSFATSPSPSSSSSPPLSSSPLSSAASSSMPPSSSSCVSASSGSPVSSCSVESRSVGLLIKNAYTRLYKGGSRVYVHLTEEVSPHTLRLYVYLYAVLLRAILIIYGEWQDRHLRVKYTDIDYKVYTDAAQHMYQGGSPYSRHTYRYTPLIAFLCLGNITIHSATAKILFSLFDILLTFLTEQLLLFLHNYQSSSISSSSSSSPSFPSSSSSHMQIAHEEEDSSSSSSLSSSQSQIAKERKASFSSSSSDSVQIFYPFLLPAFCWTIFPLAGVVSTRGNADVVPCLISLLLLYFLRTRHLHLAAICYGLAVHVKLFPVMYGIPLLLFLGVDKENHISSSSSFHAPPSSSLPRLFVPLFSRKEALRLLSSSSSSVILLYNLLSISVAWNIFLSLTHLFLLPFLLPFKLIVRLDRIQWTFTLVSISTFFLLGGISWHWYGWPFIYESYLYHFVRVDIRHNFSLFFYLLYLTAQTPSKVLAFITFLPQVSLCLLVGCHYAQKGMIEFALFLQTLVFVALNKVCTTQYFLWWLCLLPFAIASTDMTSRRCWEVIGLLAFFQGTNFVWLYFGYAVEFKGKASFFQMFLSAILFTFSQFLLVWFFILHSKKKMSSSSSSHLSKKRKNERKTLQKTIPEDNNDAVKCARREKEKHF